MRLPNITLLLHGLREAGWCMTAFPFKFNGVNCLVLFEDARALGREARYVAAILTFRDMANADHYVEVAANAGGIDLNNSNKREFYNFFHIQYGKLNNFWDHFKEALNTAIPAAFHVPTDHSIVIAISRQISVRSNDPDPNAVYCCGAFRLSIDPRTGKQMYRSSFMETKMLLLRRRLYELIHAKTEPSITFKYSTDPDKELSDEVIIQRFAQSEVGRKVD